MPIKRISILFLEFLERQFPIDESNRRIQLRSASEFAEQLAVHVNHLNRAVKTATGKTTSQVMPNVQEFKILLKHSTWRVSELAWFLGFTEVSRQGCWGKHTFRSGLMDWILTLNQIKLS